ncbi:MAG: archease [Bacteroidetes bacterium]|nr:archease [Bacteroidota bacterium]
MKQEFKFIDHPSDFGIEAYGESVQDVFKNAALGLISAVAVSSGIEIRQERKIEINAMDRDNLLVRWLTEILYLYDAEKFLTADVKFEKLTETFLKAKIFGEVYNSTRHELKADVKAVTYHQLKIEEKNGDWTARIFVDV